MYLAQAHQVAEDFFLAWNDDSEGGYQATFSYTIPAAGDYKLAVLSSLSRPTYGEFRLLFIAFNFTISNDLPRLDYLTFIDIILVSTFVVTSLVIILALWESRGLTARACQSVTDIYP